MKQIFDFLPFVQYTVPILVPVHCPQPNSGLQMGHQVGHPDYTDICSRVVATHILKVSYPFSKIHICIYRCLLALRFAFVL